MTKAQDKFIKNFRSQNFKKYISVTHKDNGEEFFNEVRLLFVTIFSLFIFFQLLLDILVRFIVSGRPYRPKFEFNVVGHVNVHRCDLFGLIRLSCFELAKGPDLELNVLRHVCVDRVDSFRLVRPSCK